MRYNCKKILNNIKSVVPHPDLDKLVRKDMPGIKNMVASKHAAIMTGIATGIISEDMGFSQMRLMFVAADDKVEMWMDQVDNMIEFLEELKEHHGFKDYMNLDDDQKKMFDYITKEIIKYQRLSAELIGLSMYIDTMVDEYGLLGPLDGMEDDDDDDDYMEEDPDEDGEDLDILHDSDTMVPASEEDILKEEDDDEDVVDDTEYLKDHNIDVDLYNRYRDNIEKATKCFFGSQTENHVYMLITYPDGDGTNTICMRCNRNDSINITVDFGPIVVGPQMLKPELTLDVLLLEHMADWVGDSEHDNPFHKWYYSTEGCGFQTIADKWGQDSEK